MRLLTILAIGSCLAAMAFALEPIGTASSSASFELNGIVTRSDGVSSWPVMPGDEVRSGISPVVIRFQDGSRMSISEQSRVKLVRNGDALDVNLTGGTAYFNLAPQSALRVYNSGRAVGTRSGSIAAGNQAGVVDNAGPRATTRRVPPPPVSSQ
jgi:hypothetical protein